jgi:carbon storage regulator
MLVLTRKLRESITIGDVIRITVVEIRGRQVKLAIEAPREVVVHRTEVLERIYRESGQPRPGNGPESISRDRRERRGP